MTNVDKIRDALVGGINLAKSAGWTRYQKDEVAEAEEALRLFDEMMGQGSDSLPLPPQDVEEFIAERSLELSYGRDSVMRDMRGNAVSVYDLRAWMTGHVRVPVETMQAIQAGFHEAATEVLGWGAYASEYFQKKHGLTDSAAVFTRMADDIGNLLNASKGE